MAKIVRREWTSKGPLGKRVRHVAFGYTLYVNGKRERKFSSAWTYRRGRAEGAERTAAADSRQGRRTDRLT